MSTAANIDRIGSNVLRGVLHTQGIFQLMVRALSSVHAFNKRSVRQVLYRQIYFTGYEALSTIAIIGALIGIVIITQITNIVGANPLLIGKILVWTVVRELGPLLAAIIIIARSSTALASELGSMKANREMDNLVTMGIDPFEYLIVPRVFGSTACLIILTFYFQAISIAGGLVISSFFVDVPIIQQIRGIFSILGVREIIISMIKSAVFGLLISSVSCYHGLRVESSITEIPQVTSRAVMQSLSLIIIFDGIITVAYFV